MTQRPGWAPDAGSKTFAILGFGRYDGADGQFSGAESSLNCPVFSPSAWPAFTISVHGLRAGSRLPPSVFSAVWT